MKKAYDLNDRVGNDYYRARCLYNFGNINYKKGYLRKAGYFTKQALFFANKSKNEKILYRAENLLGLIEYDNTEYDRSIMHFQNALKKISETDFNDYYATIYFNLGNLTITKEDTLNALAYYELARKHALVSKDTLTELITYNSIALIEIDKNRNKAEKYFKKALILSKKANEYSETFNIHINLSNLYNKKRDFEKSIHHLRDAEALIDKIGNKNLYFYINFNYGGLYEKENYQKAIEFYHKAEGIYDLGGIPIEQKISLLKSISNAYAKNENFKKANEYQDHYYKLKDSLFTIEKEKDYNRLFTKFEVEKKNNKITQLTQEKEIESLRGSRLLIILLLLLAMIVAICFIFFQNIRSQKKLREKEEKINISKGILEGQNEERNRLAKELHDGVAGSLVGINLMLEHENDVQKTEKIIEIQKNINNLYEEIREISHDLKTGISEDANLQQLIRSLASSYERIQKFKTNFLFFPDNIFSDMDFNFKMDIYRVFQEIFTNKYKHSGARNIDITCTQNSENINIIIEDNGKGFPENYTEGIGLKNIRERLNKYQGEMMMENSKQGSITILNIPMK
ncbi:signal transduction histidine kinase [Epilithonimonas hungarica]|uniref:tetratricopeptide repeat-containing sensor histidine kinase n=1 Tax=Epilithonimonas hungarica TaxID=454006 RepID=UPI002784FFE0|nr:tetratricopeptide repeat-containing sensor histidine kinase [Epilithonimonas hungarica]MDP9956532.1 signal transduction histidine kinase [Epilithonimonas hungarica]